MVPSFVNSFPRYGRTSIADETQAPSADPPRTGIRRHHLSQPRTSSAGAPPMSFVLGPNQYGKAENRVVRIYRDTDRHEIRDLNVSTSLRGDFRDAHITGDQGDVLPTDTQKN